MCSRESRALGVRPVGVSVEALSLLIREILDNDLLSLAWFSQLLNRVKISGSEEFFLMKIFDSMC